MLEVLIVDDEPLARESLKYLIDWEEHGFAITAEAEDGVRALELIRERHFSLVLTDIRMPRMSGLQFIEQLQECSEAKVIILSGYEDFDFVRQGLKLGVTDYLLKPVDEVELIHVLQRVVGVIKERERMKRREQLGLTVLRDQFLRKLAHGQAGGQELGEQSELLGLELGGSCCCLLLELDFLSGEGKEISEQDMELKRYAIRNIAEELCSGSGYLFEESEERFGIFLMGDGGNVESGKARQLAEALAAAAKQYAKETVTIGIGEWVQAAGRLADSYSGAEAALDGKFLIGGDTILTGRADRDGMKQQDTGKLREDLLEAVRSNREEALMDALAVLWDSFRAGGSNAGGGASAGAGDHARMTVLELLVQLLQVVKTSGASSDTLFNYELGDYERVMRAKTIDELYAITASKCIGVLELLRQMKELQPHHVVTEVKKIVQQEYHTNISLRSVAQKVYLNPNYLGKVFKAGMDQSFNDYLLHVRMEKAKQLLLGSNKKVYEIAQEIGYGELDWFYKRFKAYVGISAGEYRGKSGR
ncbi:two-component system response regulator YesN [Paenibacillus endophyticus]|uniref:Two-component system response regulator YesN n=1 Tax=Paenibacillus endophyticus TaxID=1294268 RepID=A0A7W5C8X1_9BACL|nr:response regulator [Paenibacillus endophyticus]MBB3152329.1 two-component system response regulator YesN [Paenibacillus endophyticus]